MVLNVPTVTLVLPNVLKFVMLKILKASPLSCSLIDSPKRKFLKSEKSTRFVGGPSIPPRGALPGTFEIFVAVEEGFAWKHARLKYSSLVCGAFALGSQSIF